MVSSTFYSFKTLVWQRQCYMILFHYIFLGHRGRSAFLWLRNIRLGSDHENDHECDISKYGDKILHANHLKSVFPFCHNLACYIWRWWHQMEGDTAWRTAKRVIQPASEYNMDNKLTQCFKPLQFEGC